LQGGIGGENIVEGLELAEEFEELLSGFFLGKRFYGSFFRLVIESLG
jgi:hypothetical protein